MKQPPPIVFHVTAEQKAALMARAEQLDITLSELLRRLLRNYLIRCEQPRPRTLEAPEVKRC